MADEPGGSGRRSDQLRSLGLAFEFGETTSRGAATELSRQAARDRWPLVVAVGGDGTVNETINGLMDASGRAGPSLGVIMTGRGGDACRNLGVSLDPGAAARRLVAGEEVSVDLGAVESRAGRLRYFVNAMGAGFDAMVARRAESRGGSGTVPYLRAVIGALWTHRPVPATIHVDDQPVWSGRMTAAVVANGACYGGGMRIAPAADPTDGALDLVILGELGRAELLRWLPTVYRGAHQANPKVSIHRARSILIHAAAPVPVHVDGESAGETPIRVRVCAGALRLRR